MVGFARRFRSAVEAEFARQGSGGGPPWDLSGPSVDPRTSTDRRTLTDEDLNSLPPAVAAYVRASGALGRPVPRNWRLVFDAEMFRAPGQAPMRARSVQFNFFDAHPARMFLMRARMFGLPVRALHVYRDEAATFQVRAASMVTIVDLAGPEISRAETVTVLNDVCVYAPGALGDPRLEWGATTGRTAEVRFTNGPHVVSATLEFDADGRLVDFWSDDRPEASTGTFVASRWRTPLSAYREFAGVRVPTEGSARYERPDGEFEYGRFHLRSVERDLAASPWVLKSPG